MVVVPFPARILQRSTEAVLIWRGKSQRTSSVPETPNAAKSSWRMPSAWPSQFPWAWIASGTEQRPVGEIVKAIRSSYDLTPRGIIDRLHLLDVDYNDVAAYGHFGRCGLPWEE